MLLCPVRDCRLPLIREQGRVFCERKHSFDVARSGYINLLQPQERRSKQPGDTPEAVTARRRLHDRGITEPLLMGLQAALNAASNDVILDAGCGDGFYLGSLQHKIGFEGHGVDIATRAIDAAAKRYPHCEWIVANADRVLPYSDASFSKVMSITARMNSAEFRRVLRGDGQLLVAIPSPEDLKELRQPDGEEGRGRVASTLQTFASEFDLTGQQRLTTTAELDAEAVKDVLVSIYRPLQAKPAEAGRATFSLDVLMFRPRSS
jgi:23S rRNA (guanine745-N1)-methyltransferase